MTKMTVNGVTTTTAPGQEQYEPCTWGFGRKRERVIHYEYRHTNGKLFGCFAKTIEECRIKRDKWLEKQAH